MNKIYVRNDEQDLESCTVIVKDNTIEENKLRNAAIIGGVIDSKEIINNI